MTKEERYSRLTDSLSKKQKFERLTYGQLDKLADALYDATQDGVAEVLAVLKGASIEPPHKGADHKFALKWFDHILTFAPVYKLAIPPDWVKEYIPLNSAARLVVIQTWAENQKGSNILQDFFIFSDGKFLSKGIAGRFSGEVDDESVSYFPLSLFEALERNVTYYHPPQEDLDFSFEKDDDLQVISAPIGFRYPESESSFQP